MDSNLKALIDIAPEREIEIRAIYELIKENPKALLLFKFALIKKMDLNHLEAFIFKLYKKTDSN